MAATKAFILSVLLVLALIWRHTESKTVLTAKQKASTGVRGEKRATLAAIGVIGSAVGVAAAIQGAACTFSGICGGDAVTQKLEALETKLDALESDVKSIKKDVEDIWDVSKRKWYFKHIEYIVSQRKKVIGDLKRQDNSSLAKDRRQRFINEVLGGAGNDEYVEKALFHIPGLVTKEQLVQHHLDVQVQSSKTTSQAAELTWKFIKKLFRFQEDGYASVVFAAAMKYKDDKDSYDRSMSQVCTWWSKYRDIEFNTFCATFVRDPDSRERRKIQQDYIFEIRGLFLYPGQQVKRECFADADGLHYAAGHLFVSHRATSKISIVNGDTLAIVHTINLPGSECGGSCHPFDVTIHADNKVMAVAAQSTSQGGSGDSYVMMYNIRGDLNEPSGLTIEHYYTMLQLFRPEDRKPDVRGVAFCGNRFAYADYSGAIYNWRMRGGSDPEPMVRNRYDWYIDRAYNSINGNIRYLGCSTSGTSWVVATSGAARSGIGVGAVPADSSARSVDIILRSIADIVVTQDSWDDVRDGRSRMNIIRGIAMDAKRNLFYSAHQLYKNGVSGIYQRTYDGKRRYIREWDHEGERSQKTEIYDMAVDDSGFLFVVQRGFAGTCLHKYAHEIDFADMDVPLYQ